MLHEGRKKFQNWRRNLQCLRRLCVCQATITADLERKHLRSEFVRHVLVFKPLFFLVFIRLKTKEEKR